MVKRRHNWDWFFSLDDAFLRISEYTGANLNQNKEMQLKIDIFLKMKFVYLFGDGNKED